MTNASTNPAPLTPGEKLASKRWRYTNSWWIFPPVLSFGFLGWLGFLVASIRTGKGMYWVFTAAYALAFALFITLIGLDPASVAYGLAFVPFVVSWLGPTIHAAIINRQYLTALANKGNWYEAAPTYPGTGTLQQPPAFLGVSHDAYYAPTNPPIASDQPAHAGLPQHPRPEAPQSAAPASATYAQPIQVQAPHPVDVQSATVEALAQLPGVGPSLAQRIVAIRDARGGYRNIDDLASAANLQPHELVRLRDQLTFNQDDSSQAHRDNPTQHGGSGRILDI